MPPSKFPYYFRNDEEEEYWNLIQVQLEPYFPAFVSMASQQSMPQRSQGRCAVVDYKNSKVEITNFETASELQNYLGSQDPVAFVQRRLFILEDLPLDYVTALGSHFRVPPSFFAGHHDDPATYTFNHRNPFLRSSNNRIRLRYAITSRVEIESPKSDTNIYAFNSHVCRHLHVYTPKSVIYDEARSYHTLSFWSTPLREDGGWDAVMITDPPLRDSVRCVKSPQRVELRHRLKDERSMPKLFLHPEIDLLHQLSEHSSIWNQVYSLPDYASMFNATIDLLAAGNSASLLQTPIEAFEIPHKLLISQLIAFMRRRYTQLVTVQKNQQGFRMNYSAKFTEGCFASWDNALYDWLAGTCAAMKEFVREINENIAELGLDRPHNMITAEAIPQWQIDGWKSVQELTRVVDDLAQSSLASYLQFIALQEARVSNTNALNLSRITVLTMLFIPLSTVASIFSMSGDYLPGEKRWWMFWVSSVPLLILLACLYWQRWILAVLKRRQTPHEGLYEFVTRKNFGS